MRRTPPAHLRRRAGSATLVAVLSAAAPAGAQPKPAESAAPTTAPVPAVDDPLLAPPAAAPTELASWDDARRLLVTASTDVRRADASVARADALVRQARSSLMPDVRAAIEGSIDLLDLDTAPGIPPGDDWHATSPLLTTAVTLTQPLIDLAARRGRAAARDQRRSAGWIRIDTERRASHALARALIAVAAAVRVTELNRLGLRQALERAALTERTYQLGAAIELDVVRVQQDVAVARSALIAGDEDLRVAREELGLILGIDGEVGIGAALTDEHLIAAITGDCQPLRDGEVRADVAAAAAEIDAARRRREQARAGYWPTLDLQSSLFAFTTDPAPGRVGSWTVSLVLSVPLWEGGLRAGLIAERQAAEADAAAVAEDVRRQARVESARSRRGERVSHELVDSATEARALAERVDTMTRRSFEIGRATSLELVQSAAALRQADLTLALRHFEWVSAQVDELLTEARCDT